MQEFIEHLAAGNDLEKAQVHAAVSGLVSTTYTDQEKARFLKALRGKGETGLEIATFVEALLGHAVDPEIEMNRLPGPAIDVCGTGGDRQGLFNVSTTAMFVVSAAGAVVLKHGNRSITSKCGGADVLEALGIRIDLPPEMARRCFEEIGVGFLFAPNYHPAFKAIGPVRRMLAEEGVASIFNLLGPLLNPARPAYQLAGIFSVDALSKYAEVLALLGRKKAWAVHGDGSDEIATTGLTVGREVTQEGVTSFELTPEQLGIPSATIQALQGGDREQNAATMVGILDGTIRDARRDLVVVNAAGALLVTGLAADWPEAIGYAAEQIDRGRAFAKLKQLAAFGD